MSAEFGLDRRCNGCEYQIKKPGGFVAKFKESFEGDYEFIGDKNPKYPHCEAARLPDHPAPNPNLPFFSNQNGVEECSRYVTSLTQDLKDLRQFLINVPRKLISVVRK